jgi:PAS domain S-box-containing protein
MERKNRAGSSKKAKLQDTGKKYRAIFDNVNVAIILHDINDGSFIDVNQTMCELFLYSRAEALKLKIEDISSGKPPYTQKEALLWLKKAARGKLQVVEWHCRDKKGRHFWVEVNFKLLDFEGETSVMAVIRDITGQKKAEKSLMESESKLQTIFDNARDGILVADVENKKFLAGNKTILSMLGYSFDEIRNLGVFDIHPEKDLPYVIEQFEKQSRNEIIAARDMPVKRKDGSVFYADINSSPVVLDDKSCLIGTFREITERKAMEDALKKSEIKYRTLFEGASDAIYLIDPETGQILDCNNAAVQMDGYNIDELKKMRVRDLHPEEDHAVLAEKFGSVMDVGHGYYLTGLQHVGKDGGMIPVEVNATTVEISGRPLNLSIVRNIEDRRRAEAILRNIAEKVSVEIGEAFFQSMVKFLAETLEAEYALIGERAGPGSDIVRTVAVYASGNIADNFEYELSGTPCANVMGQRLCLYPTKVQDKFPGDILLQEMGVDSYIGTPLFDSKKRPIGIIAVMGKAPIKDEELASSMIQLFAARASSEMERKNAEEKLGRYAERLKTLNAIDQDILAARSTEEISTAVLQRINEVLPCQRASVVRFDMKLREASIIAVFDRSETSLVAGKTISVDEYGFFEDVIKGNTKIVENISDISEPSAVETELLKEGIRSVMNVPVSVGNEVLGALNIGSRTPGAFSQEYVDIASELADLLAIAFQHTRHNYMLKEERDKAQKYFDVAGVMLLALDSRGNIELINKKGCEILGRSEDEVLGRNWFESFIPERIRREMDEVFRKIMSGEENIDEYYVNSILTRSGEERLIAWHNSVLRDRSGRVTGTLSSGEDITEKREMEERIATIFVRSPVGISIASQEGKIIHSNPAMQKMLGYSGDELHRKFKEITHPDDVAENLRLFREMVQGKREAYFMEKRYIRKDGTIVWANLSVTAIRDPDGKFKYNFAIVEDISERKMLEDQLRHAQKMEAIGQLAGGIAHDFNNILTAIIGYGNLLKMRAMGDGNFLHNVNQIIAITERGAGLTQSLLAFSRKQDISLNTVNLNDLIQRIGKLIPRLIGEEIEFKEKFADEKLIIMGDSSQLEQVIMNLASNSRDSMPDGGTLTIETSHIVLDREFVKTHGYGQPGTYAYLAVTDTGEGIENEIIEKIFEPFFTTKDVGEGTGLGLSLVYGIIKQHSGYIYVESEPGRGTSFKIYLPLVKKKVADINAGNSISLTGGNETILLAEDETAVRGALKGVLEEFGYKVLEACDGKDAIEKFNDNKEKINLLIFDVVMPVMSGKEAYDEIKKINPQMKVIFTSGHTSKIIYSKGVPEDVNFIAKPVMPQSLVVKVREVLDES